MKNKFKRKDNKVKACKSTLPRSSPNSSFDEEIEVIEVKHDKTDHAFDIDSDRDSAEAYSDEDEEDEAVEYEQEPLVSNQRSTRQL